MSHDGARWENLLQLELSENIFPSLQTLNRHALECFEVPELLLNFTASLEKYWETPYVSLHCEFNTQKYETQHNLLFMVISIWRSEEQS